jgi:Site-specific recombinase XerD
MVKQKARRVGTVEARGENRWLVRVFLGRDDLNKRKYAAKTVLGSRKDAEMTLATMVAAQDQGTFVAPSKQTLGDFLTQWLDNDVSMKVSEGTLVTYRQRLTTDIIKPLGHHRLDKVTSQMIQAQYRKLTAEGLGSRSVQYTHVLLRTALKKAVGLRLLNINPTEHATVPKREHREMSVWVEEQVSTFLGLAAGHALFPLWHLLFATGLRPQEALALKWGDLDGNKLRVQRALKTTSVYKAYEVGETKTKRGKRSVTLPAETMVVLQPHRRTQAAAMLKGGASYKRNDYIFADDEGEHLSPPNVARQWKTLVKRSKLPAIRLYDTRHTHATILLRACVNPKVVADRLGHASVVITLDTYSHVLPDTQEEVAVKLDTLLFKKVM